jgi:hypothetical protein
VHAGLELAFVLDQVFHRKRLVGEAHVHHARRMAFGRREVDQTAFAQNDDAVARL